MKSNRKLYLLLAAAIGLVAFIVQVSSHPYKGEGKSAWYNPEPLGAATVGVNINAVTLSTAGVGTCNWQVAPYCRVIATATAVGASGITLSNPVDGSQYIFEYDQDATGESLTWPTVVTAPGGGTAPFLPGVASAVEIVSMTYNATLGKYVINWITSQGAAVNVHQNCTAPITLSSGAASTTLPACFAGYSKVGILSFAGAGSPTAAVTTPTTLAVSSVECAQTAANGLTVNCVSSSGSDARVILLTGVN